MKIKREYGDKAMVKTRGEAAPINMANVRVKFGAQPGEEDLPSPGMGGNLLTDTGLSLNESMGGVKAFFADQRKQPDAPIERDLKCIHRYP